MEELLIQTVENYGLLAIFASLLIGILTSLAPCSIVTLPLLVGSAVTLSEDMDVKTKKRFIYQYSALFVLGLVISFSILLLLVSKIGMMLSVAPFWAYALASIATFVVVAYAMGYINGVDKDKIAKKFIKLKLLGAVIIGLIFGLVSTPCATAPLASIVMVAQSSGWVYSYALVLAFALGHGSLLLFAGISLGFAQSIASSQKLNRISKFINAFFIIALIVIGLYFAYKAYQIF
ncbi:MAG: cytochrome C biogenesis protein [Campylobacterales bacterium]|nr:cytochrome C biogenesis protein [Campylobacterales bacterium]HEO99597.1 cytochrome C biogenesis protein [Campylobacterota bacterium]